MPPPGKKWLTVAAVTMTSQTNTVANLQMFYSYMEQAASNRVDLIVFPEVALQGCPEWSEGYVKPSPQALAYVRNTAETVPGPSSDKLLAKAKELGIHVVFGMTEKNLAGEIYNAVLFLGPDGVIGTHRKSLHFGNDGLIWSRGTQLIQVFESPLGRVGLMICGEMGGESASVATGLGPRLAAQGADFLITSSAWWTSTMGLYDLATKENARVAARWHVIADQVGLIGYATCYGHSRIVDPLGRIVCDTGAKEGLVMWPTDMMINAGP